MSLVLMKCFTDSKSSDNNVLQCTLAFNLLRINTVKFVSVLWIILVLGS